MANTSPTTSNCDTLAESVENMRFSMVDWWACMVQLGGMDGSAERCCRNYWHGGHYYDRQSLGRLLHG